MRKRMTTRKSYGMQRNKNRSKTSKKYGGTADPTPPPPKRSLKEHAAFYGSKAKSYAQSVVKANQAALNMPVALAAQSYKINALLVHFKVPYIFSNGYDARDYSLEVEPANSKNDGRGKLNPNAKKNEATGFKSAFDDKRNDILKQNKTSNNKSKKETE